MKRAEAEILILFSTPNALSRQDKAGALELLKEAVLPPRNVKIRILIAADSNTDGMTTTMTNERILQLKEFGIDVRITRQQRQHQVNFLRNNNLAVMIVDQSFYFSVELNDGTKEEASEEKEDAIRLATYSNKRQLFLLICQYLRIFGWGRRHNNVHAFGIIDGFCPKTNRKDAQFNTVVS